MELKLAKIDHNAESNTITLEEIVKAAQSEKFFYFAQENKEKDLQKVMQNFIDKNRFVKLGKVSYGLDEKDFVYELHII
ncbi:hypothetical protein LW135_05720 [Helicobacter sp. faydin-H20]|uniref:HP0268 family nuclease n=1 Tax=Helicobacter anatolicus TaxID=2905874 RepID=UPI001E5A08B3|nr:HP0268 family nuclease [Helicobacter anatolicus]MCE3037329.1 hypothetical protein [Helicobacter anatolicus]